MRLDWRSASSYCAVIIGEACWIYAWTYLLNGQVAAGSLSALGFLLFFILAVLFNKLLQYLWLHPFFRSLLSWLAWAAATLLWVKLQFFGGSAFTDSAWLLAVPRAVAQVFNVFQPELLILLCSIVIWWLARRLARVRLSFALSVGEFQFGLIILLISFLVASRVGVSIAGAVPLALVFFAVSLSGISIARMREDRASAADAHRGHWLALLIISVCLVLAVGFLVGLAVTPGLLETLISAVQWLVGEVWKWILWLTSLLPTPAPPANVPKSRGFELPQPTAGEPLAVLWAVPDWLRTILGWIWGVIMVGLILLLIWRISTQVFDWFRRSRRASPGVEYEKVPGMSFNDLYHLFGRALRTLLNFLMPSRFSPSARAEVNSVRQVYRHVLQWAASKGQPRRLSQTPAEYVDVLVNMLPAKRAELEFITQQYTESRYGYSVPAGDGLDRMKHAWQEIRQSHVKKRTNQLPEPGKGD